MSAGRIAVAMSGGVDSSAAAALLQEAGEDLVGFSMQLWDQRRSATGDGEPAASRCCSTDDLYDARDVARRSNVTVIDDAKALGLLGRERVPLLVVETVYGPLLGEPAGARA